LEDFFEAADAPVRNVVAGAIDELGKAGARLRQIRLATDLASIAAAQQTIMQVEAAEIHAQIHAEHAEHYAPRMRALIETGQLIPGVLYVRAQRLRRRFRQEVATALRDVDCLVLPTASNLAPARDTTGDRTFQAPWSLIGVPALTLPCGRADDLPCGLQIVAGAGQDAHLLAIARWAEAILPPLASPVG
jgi:Asp-tRNA(Asn)/Glu-tRNA(Gln) amidotransferase A subunit family amidase